MKYHNTYLDHHCFKIIANNKIIGGIDIETNTGLIYLKLDDKEIESMYNNSRIKNITFDILDFIRNYGSDNPLVYKEIGKYIDSCLNTYLFENDHGVSLELFVYDHFDFHGTDFATYMLNTFNRGDIEIYIHKNNICHAWKDLDGTKYNIFGVIKEEE
jgi:hypothetical protein